MTCEPSQLCILAIINLGSGLCFGYLFRKFSYKCSVIYIDKKDTCTHDWELYTDQKRSGSPFVRQCKHCKKREYYDF